jgi:hypothetical protein
MCCLTQSDTIPIVANQKYKIPKNPRAIFQARFRSQTDPKVLAKSRSRQSKNVSPAMLYQLLM